jgi:hypothetical protein
MNNKKLSYCDFCVYKTSSGCNAKPNSAYCTEAKNEYYQYIRSKGSTTSQPAQKSLRSWDKKR